MSMYFLQLWNKKLLRLNCCIDRALVNTTNTKRPIGFRQTGTIGVAKVTYFHRFKNLHFPGAWVSPPWRRVGADYKVPGKPTEKKHTHTGVAFSLRGNFAVTPLTVPNSGLKISAYCSFRRSTRASLSWPIKKLTVWRWKEVSPVQVNYRKGQGT